GERTARRLHVTTGDRPPVVTYTPGQAANNHSSAGVPPGGPPPGLPVPGTSRAPDATAPRETHIGTTLLTPAFTREYGTQSGDLSHIAFVRLRDPSQLSQLAASVQAAGDVQVDRSFSAESYRDQTNATMRALATGLLVFALVAGTAGAVALAQ